MWMREFIDAANRLNESLDVRVMSGAKTKLYVDEHDPDLWTNKRIRYLIRSHADDETHIVVERDGRIIGMGGVQTNPYDPEHLWIKFISVDPEEQGKGLGRMILERIFQYAVEHHQKIAPGSFTEEGSKLAHLHDEFDAKYPAAAFRKINGKRVDSQGKIIR